MASILDAEFQFPLWGNCPLWVGVYQVNQSLLL